MFGLGNRMSKKQRRDAAPIPMPGASGLVATTVVSGTHGVTVHDHTNSENNSMDIEREDALRSWPTQAAEPTIGHMNTQSDDTVQGEDEEENTPPEPFPVGVDANNDVSALISKSCFLKLV